MNGKGSNRRIESTVKVSENLDKIKWGVRDKSKDTFKVNINTDGDVKPDDSLNTLIRHK